ncbi:MULTISPECIES: hypothetical protein [Ligilactobacillus]|jgi:hypothetical protein|uniref:Uncharacterized protein n=1 Tax=Ligilactobacillus murinus TaxID=1622 RepID=A0AAE6WFT1_9LACO|nr:MULTISPECIES: hypothetical protein [Ligilactobacillus]NEF85818.1 hypothetical protein [Ligilactobacillus murinus]NEF88184.1 hypothetical protein [Ligilactobacillus murinus]NEF92719.1 hypothetical protein [Ligilactobacillus murinus]NEF97122.1 hypothetical protein [Ligilactobacillus murinus]NEF99481.1 hypothetical protein [Ligilactobacillus murinus]
MAIETWDSPYIVIWLCLGVLATVLTFGTRGYSDKLNGLEAIGYSVIIGALAILNGAALGQTMYDKTAKYDIWGSLGTMLGLSGPLIVSGLILIVFYRNRVVKHPDEVTVKGEDLEINKSYLLGGITSFMTYGLLAAGIGAMYIVMALVGDREGLLIASTVLIPLIVAIWLITQYRKWMFKYIVWVLRRKGLLQVVDNKKENK